MGGTTERGESPKAKPPLHLQTSTPYSLRQAWPHPPLPLSLSSERVPCAPTLSPLFKSVRIDRKVSPSEQAKKTQARSDKGGGVRDSFLCSVREFSVGPTRVSRSLLKLFLPGAALSNMPRRMALIPESIPHVFPFFLRGPSLLSRLDSPFLLLLLTNGQRPRRETPNSRKPPFFRISAMWPMTFT